MGKRQRTAKARIKHTPALTVEFCLPDAGWIFFKCQPLTEHVSASCYDDPFPAMIDWLEAIIDGAQLARWSIGEEGSIADFIFSNTHSHGFDSVECQLIYVGSGSFYGATDRLPQPHLVNAITCPRRELVQTFYLAFRSMAEHPEFNRREWLSSVDAGGYRDVDILDPHLWETLEEHPLWQNWPCGWSGTDLRSLRSAKIEAFLSGSQPEQLQFAMPFQ